MCHLHSFIEPIKKIGEPDHESSAVEWISLDNLPSAEEFAFDHAETIKLYLDFKKEQFPLPKLI